MLFLIPPSENLDFHETQPEEPKTRQMVICTSDNGRTGRNMAKERRVIVTATSTKVPSKTGEEMEWEPIPGQMVRSTSVNGRTGRNGEGTLHYSNGTQKRGEWAEGTRLRWLD